MISDFIHALTGYISIVSVFFLSFLPANPTIKGTEIIAKNIPTAVEKITLTPTAFPISITDSIKHAVISLPGVDLRNETTATPIPSIIKPSATPTTLPTSTLTSTLTPTLSKIQPSPTPSPTLTPTPTKIIIKPIFTQTPTPTSTPTPTPLPVPSVPVIPGLNAGLVFDLVNNYRADLGLPVFKKDDTTCKLAAFRAPQVYDEIFVTYKYHAGFYALNLPYWSTENIIYHSTEQEAVNWWIQDEIHRKIIEKDYKYSCVACYGNACSQIFTSYIPR